MKNNIYIIPGLGETCNLARYQALGNALKSKESKVIYINPDWYNTLSEQVFPVGKNDIIIGFSYGAVLAYLISKKFTCKKIILASLSPIHKFSYKSLVIDYCKHMSKKMSEKLSKEIKSIKINLNTLETPRVLLIGEKEKDEFNSDIIIPKTGHYLTSRYINVIKQLVSN